MKYERFIYQYRKFHAVMWMDGKGFSSIVGALLVFLLTVVTFGMVYVFVISQTDALMKQVSETKPITVSAQRDSSNRLYFYLLNKGGANSVTDCRLDASTYCGSFSDVGDKINCGTPSKDTHTLVCSVDGVKQVVWKGYI
jgi:FlaG/FlaF family flagellin (archaellin)